jgi:DNA anti-recombination protein RmuC
VNKRQDLLNRIQNAASHEDKDATVRELEKLLSELRSTPDAATQNEVNRLQSQVNRAQDSVNELQHKVNQEQGHVNEEQQKVNHEQHLVNEEQHRVSSEFRIRIQDIFESAIRKGLVQKVN